MKTNKLVMISLGILVFGLLIGGIGFLCGGRVFGLAFDRNGIYVNGNQNSETGEGAKYIEETKELEAFQNLRLDISFADVEIRESDHYGIEYCMQEERIVLTEMQGDTMVMSQKHPGASLTFFSLGNAGLTNHKREYLIVNVPKGQEYGNIEIDIDSGDLELNDIKAEEMKLKNSFGSITANSLTADTMDISMDSGDTNIEQIEAGSLVMDNSFGSLKLNQANVGSGKIEFDSGDIEFDTMNVGTLTLKNSFGSIDGKQLAVGNLVLNMDSGDCEIADLTVGHAEVDNSFGSMELGLREGVEAYSADVDVEFGSVEVNGEDMGSKYKNKKTDSEHELIVDSDSGDVTIYDVK